MGLAGVADGLLVAVDGGNSKTDVAVATSSGRVLSLVHGPGATAHALGVQNAVAAIDGLIGQALQAADADARRVTHAGIYLAGVDFDREKDELEVAVARKPWASDVVVENDTFALLRAGTVGSAVAIVCGAGINCVAVNPAGETLRFPSLGRISGDWGGGGHLSGEVMAAAARDEDGRGPRTALAEAVRRQFGTDSVLQAIERLHFGEIEPARLHDLNPLLFAVADSGDQVARALVEQLADEIAALAVAATRRLGLDLTTTPVVLGGGVLAARHPLLSERVERRIRDVDASARFVYVTDRPILGALLLVAERGGWQTGTDTIDRFRRGLAAPEPARAQAARK